jgi:hypothetical protein
VTGIEMGFVMGGPKDSPTRTLTVTTATSATTATSETSSTMSSE